MWTLISLLVGHRAPQLGLLLVCAGLAGLVTGVVPFITGLLVAAIAVLGVLAVRLAVTLPDLAGATGSRRAVQETGPPNS